jgi:hypothetical protein
MNVNDDQNGIKDSRAAAGMDDDAGHSWDGMIDKALDEAAAVVDAMGLQPYGDPTLPLDDDIEDDLPLGDAADEDEDELDDDEEPEVFEPATVAAWVRDLVSNPNIINDVPEAIRGDVGNAAQALVTQLDTVGQSRFTSGLQYGMKYAEYADLYTNDRDSFDELPEEERELYNDLTKRFRVEREAAKNPPPTVSDSDREIQAEAGAMLQQLAASHPEIHAQVEADLRAGKYSSGTTFGAYQRMVADINTAKDAIAPAPPAPEADKDRGGSSARRRQRAAAKRGQQPRPDVAGGRGSNGSVAEELAAVNLSTPGAGRDLLERALAGNV